METDTVSDRLETFLLDMFTALRRLHAWVRAPVIVQITGGVPGPARRAQVGDIILEAKVGEIREMFEARVLQESEALALRGRASFIAFGGLPPLPGADTLMPKPATIARRGHDWWGDDDPPDDDAPPEPPRLPPLAGVRLDRS
jgi:hypothetical protein